jgi:hypothetical protein
MSDINCVDQIIDQLILNRKDLEDAFSGKTKASAPRARKALSTIADLCKQGRKDALAISKGECAPTPCTMTTCLQPADTSCEE